MEVFAHPVRQETPDAAAADEDAISAAATIAALETQVAAQATEIASLSAATAPTAEPTVEPSASAASTATPTSQGAPLLVSNDIELLYYSFGQPGFSNRTPIYGELRNTSNALMSAPTLNITFYDEEDRIVDTAEVNALVAVLQPGSSMPIDGATDLAPGTWAREEIDLQGGGAADDIALIFYAQDLEVQNVNEVEKTTDSLRVLGEIHNGGTSAANLLSIRALNYDADGRYTGFAYGQVNADSVQPGADVSFEIDGAVDAAPNWTYRILASGWPVS